MMWHHNMELIKKEKEDPSGLIVDVGTIINVVYGQIYSCMSWWLSPTFLCLCFYFFEFSSYKTGKIVFVLNYSLSRLRSVIASLTQIGQRQMVLGNVAIWRWCVHISNYSFFFSPSLTHADSVAKTLSQGRP